MHLWLLLALGCGKTDREPCAANFVRNANGACSPVEEEIPSPQDTSTPTQQTDTADTMEEEAPKELEPLKPPKLLQG